MHDLAASAFRPPVTHAFFAQAEADIGAKELKALGWTVGSAGVSQRLFEFQAAAGVSGKGRDRAPAPACRPLEALGRRPTFPGVSNLFWSSRNLFRWLRLNEPAATPKEKTKRK